MFIDNSFDSLSDDSISKEPVPKVISFKKTKVENREKLHVVQARLKQECKGDLGFVKTMKALNCLNDLQKEDCPEAYEPEIVVQLKKKVQLKQEKEQLEYDIDKTFFDFDDDIDNLSEVSERYKVLPTIDVSLQ